MDIAVWGALAAEPKGPECMNCAKAVGSGLYRRIYLIVSSVCIHT